jgi:DNA primase
MIPQESIQLVLDTAKIEDVVGDFVPLKRRGINLIGLCPFHGEKTPSFNVSPVRNIFKCFGCGVGGNAINFVMQHENYSYPEAIRYIAKKYNIELNEAKPTEEYLSQQAVADALYIINDFGAQYFQDLMWDTEYGQNVALAYFHERGLREETVRKFGLGFANGQQSDLVQTMLGRKYEADYIRQAGLSNSYGRDFFRMRVMFPVHNVAGKVVGFGGRVMAGADKSQPKYINTPESPIYNKSKSLYGIFQAKKAIAQANECLLVEGYMDVVALHQGGIENVVASSGTSLTVGQIQLIKRYTNNITILYDGDAAGIKAALRGLDLVLEQEMDVKIVSFPAGDDPDSYIRKVGETAFRAYMKSNAKDFILFKTQLLLKDTAQDPIARANALQEIVLSLAKISAPLKRDIYIRECAQLFNLEEARLHQEINKMLTSQFKKEQQQQQATALQSERAATSEDINTTDPNNEQNPFIDTTYINPHSANLATTVGQGYQERDMVRLLVQFGSRVFDENSSVAEHVLENMLPLLDEFDNPLYKEIVEMYINALSEEQILETEFFLNHERQDIQSLSVQLVVEAEQYNYSPNWERYNVYLTTQKMPEQNHKRDVASSVGRFKLKKIERMAQKNQQKLKDLQQGIQNSAEDIMLLLVVQQKLNTMRNELAKTLNTVVLK